MNAVIGEAEAGRKEPRYRAHYLNRNLNLNPALLGRFANLEPNEAADRDLIAQLLGDGGHVLLY